MNTLNSTFKDIYNYPPMSMIRISNVNDKNQLDEHIL